MKELAVSLICTFDLTLNCFFKLNIDSNEKQKLLGILLISQNSSLFIFTFYLMHRYWQSFAKLYFYFTSNYKNFCTISFMSS